MSIEQLEQFEELARRAVTCRHWRWMPGMASGWKDARGNQRVLSVDPETRCYVVDGFGIEYEWDGARLPNLSDPATLGCLAALVREATGKPWLFAQFTLQDTWSICDLHDHRSHFVGSEAEAWIEVLEEVP